MNIMRSIGTPNSRGVLNTETKVQVTLFSKQKLGVSYKCPNAQKENGDEGLEYGYYFWHIETESPVQQLQTYCCNTLVKLLEHSDNPDTIIQSLLKKQN